MHCCHSIGLNLGGEFRNKESVNNGKPSNLDCCSVDILEEAMMSYSNLTFGLFSFKKESRMFCKSETCK